MPIFTLTTDLFSGAFIWIGTRVSDSNPARLDSRPRIDQALVTTGRQFQKLQKLLDSRPLAPFVFLDHLVAKIIIFPIRLCLGHVTSHDLLMAQSQLRDLEKSLDQLHATDQKNGESISSLTRTIAEKRIAVGRLLQIEIDKEKEIETVSGQNEQLREEQRSLQALIEKLSEDNLFLLQEEQALEAHKEALEKECTDLEQTVLSHSQLIHTLAQHILEQNDLRVICQQVVQGYKQAAPLSKLYHERLVHETQEIAHLNEQDLALKQETARLEALLGEHP